MTDIAVGTGAYLENSDMPLGQAYADVVPPPTPPPGVVVRSLPIVTEVLPPPPLVRGHPEGWQGHTETGTWGRLRVAVGGKEVTFFRQQPTRITNYQLTDPYGHGPATIEMPQVNAFELPADDDTPNPDLPWLYLGALVSIDRVRPSGDLVPLWCGFVTVLRVDGDHGIALDCAGEMSGRLALVDRQQPVIHLERDIGDLIAQGWRPTNTSYTLQPNEFTVGVDMDNFYGCNQTRLAWLDAMLHMAQTQDGSWTVLPVPGKRRVYKPQLRDTSTIDFTVHYGARGVQVALTNDVAEAPNRIYGSGIAPSGEAWFNHVYPNLGDEVVPPFPGTLQRGDDSNDVLVLTYELAATPYLGRDNIGTLFNWSVEQAVRAVQADAGLPVTGIVDSDTWQFGVYADGAAQQTFNQATVAPLVADPRTLALRHAANWNVLGPNPAYDHLVVRVDRTIDYGANISKDRARANANAIMNRGQRGNWAGTITLRSDVAQGLHAWGQPVTPMGRLGVTAGMNLKLRHFAGDLTLHVSAVTVDLAGESPQVTLTVDQQGRDPLSLQEVMGRSANTRSDPARRLQHRRTGSFPTSAISGWDSESGAGYLKPTPLLGGQWNILWTPGAQQGVIKAIEYRTSSSACTFALAVFNRPVDADWLSGWVYDPLSDPGNNYTWWTKPPRDEIFVTGDQTDSPFLVYSAGGPGQACGYMPGQETGSDGKPTGHPITGYFKEMGNWPFYCHPLLWVAVYPTDACTGQGRMYVQVSEGV